MQFQKVCHGVSVWWGDGKTKWKSISLTYHLRHFFKFACYTNGAIKGRDKCFDWNFHLLGVFISYTDWNYGRFIQRG